MIELKNASKIYGRGSGKIQALSDVNLKITAEEFVTVMGPSGSGKSTLLHIIGALDTLTTGQYLLENTDIAKLSDQEMSRIRNQHFGFVFQSYNLFSELSALENVAMPLLLAKVKKSQRIEKALSLLELVDMAPRAHHYPAQLSGGEQQRVAIARALANDPDLLLADEPTGNLASQHEEEILQMFSDLHQKGVALIIVTHNPKVAAYGERLLRLYDGKIALDEKIHQKKVPEALPQIKNGVMS